MVKRVSAYEVCFGNYKELVAYTYVAGGKKELSQQEIIDLLVDRLLKRGCGDGVFYEGDTDMGKRVVESSDGHKLWTGGEFKITEIPSIDYYYRIKQKKYKKAHTQKCV